MINKNYIKHKDKHLFTAGDCNLNTFLNIMKQHRLEFKVSFIIQYKYITNISWLLTILCWLEFLFFCGE